MISNKLFDQILKEGSGLGVGVDDEAMAKPSYEFEDDLRSALNSLMKANLLLGCEKLSKKSQEFGKCLNEAIASIKAGYAAYKGK